jgi:hypothetical protein
MSTSPAISKFGTSAIASIQARLIPPHPASTARHFEAFLFPAMSLYNAAPCPDYKRFFLLARKNASGSISAGAAHRFQAS